MEADHGLVLVESELQAIIHVVEGMIDPRQVATLRLPVSVKALAAVTDAPTKEHGPGLTMRQNGEFMIVEKPHPQSNAIEPRCKFCGREAGNCDCCDADVTPDTGAK